MSLTRFLLSRTPNTDDDGRDVSQRGLARVHGRVVYAIWRRPDSRACANNRHKVRNRSEPPEVLQEHRVVESQLMLLIEASSALLSSPDSVQVPQKILNIAKRFVQADAYAVWRKRPNSSEWTVVAVDGLSESYPRSVNESGNSGSRLPVALTVIEDVYNSPLVGFRASLYRSEGIRSMLTMPLSIHGEIAGTIVFYYRSPHRFTESEKRIATALGNLASAALGTAELYERQTALRRAAEIAERRAAFLARAGELLSSSLDYETTLRSIADLAVPFFADWCAVDMLDDSGVAERLAVRHIDPEKVRFAYEFSRRYPPREDDADQVALRTGKSLWFEEVPDSLIVERSRDEEHLRLIRQLGLKSVIVVPMLARGRTRGLLTFVNAESERRFTQADLETGEELARRAAIAVDNARLFDEVRAERARAEETNIALRRANSDLEQFAYSASHDLQEPLRMVSIYSQMLRKKFGGQLGPQGDQYIGYAVEGATRMEHLVRDLLAYTRSSTVPDEPVSPVDANAALEHALANLHAAIVQTGAEIICEPLPRVRMHSVHLEQVFQNLIGNAIKYRSAEPPRINVSAERRGPEWKFSVSDNGIGIAPQYKEQIFGIFKRLHTAAEFSGTGVGLAICQRIVERVGGRIWVESEPGRGSIFLFTVPDAKGGSGEEPAPVG